MRFAPSLAAAALAVSGMLVGLPAAVRARAEDAPRRPASLTVRVVDTEGRPIPGAVVEARRTPPSRRGLWLFPDDKPLERTWSGTPAGFDETVLASATTSAEGTAALVLDASGRFDLTARAAGRAVRGAQVGLPRSAGSAAPTAIVLDAGHAVTGVASGPDGAPIAGALVLARFASLGTAREDDDERPLRTISDARGAFRIDGVPAGTATVYAAPPGTWFDRRHVVRVPGERLDIVLPVRRLAAVVRDAETGAPVPGVPVLFEARGWHHSDTYLRGRTDERGRIEGLWPSRAVVGGRVDAPGYLPTLFRPGDSERVVDLDGLGGKDAEFVLAPAATLRGTVRGPAGPVAGATVVARWRAGDGSNDETVVSGPDGSFTLRLPPGRVHVVAALRRRDADVEDIDSVFADAASDATDVVTLPAAGRDGLVVALRGPSDAEFGRVEGRVVWDDDPPPVVTAVTIQVVGASSYADTAEDGMFRLVAVPPGEHLITAEISGGRATASARVVVAAGRTASVEIRVPRPRARRVVGEVVWRKDRSHGVVWVELTSDRRRFPVRADGSFEIVTRSEPGERAEVRVTSPGEVPGRQSCPWAEYGDVTDVGAVGFGAPVRFRVVAAESGEALPDAAATLDHHSFVIACGPFEDPSESRRWSANAEGWITLDADLAPGEYSRTDVIVSATDRVARRVSRPGRSEAWRVGAEEWPTLVQLPLAAVLAGIVRCEDGRPARGVVVSAREEEFGRSGDRFDREATTDDQGRFRIDGLAPTKHELMWKSSASGDSVLRGSRADVAAPSTDLRLVALPAPSIEGVVVNVQGRPVAEARVEARGGPDRLGYAWAQTDARGAFRLAGVPAGRWTLQVIWDLHHGLARVPDVATGTRDLRITAAMGFALAGRLVDEVGRPLADRRVELSGEDASTRGAESPTTRTDAAGRFVVTGLWRGRYSVKVGTWGTIALDPPTVDVPQAKAAEVVFVLRAKLPVPTPVEQR